MRTVEHVNIGARGAPYIIRLARANFRNSSISSVLTTMLVSSAALRY
jgi:hypothetical protein